MKEVFGFYLNEIAADYKAIIDAYKHKRQLASNKLKFHKHTNHSDYLSLLDFLPYNNFNNAESLFENDRTIGFILRVSHFSGMNEITKQAFRNLITNDLPEGCFLQIINYASPKIGHLVDYWQMQGKQTDIFRKISNARKEFVLKLAQKNIIKEKPDLCVRNYELYFCFSFIKPMTETGTLEVMFKLNALREKFIQGLRAINREAKALSGNDLVSFLREILCPSNSSYKYKLPSVRSNLLEELESDQQISIKRDKIVFLKENKTQFLGNSKDSKDQYRYIIFEITNLPEVWDLASSIDYIGSFEAGLSLPCPFYISQGFALDSRENSQRMADKHRMIKTQSADSKLPMFFPKMLEERNDWHYVSEAIGQGERMGKLVMHVVLLLNQNHNEEMLAQALQDHFMRLRFSITRVHFDCLNVFLQTLPFGAGENWPILEQLKISSKVLSGACTNLMPVFADGQNYEHPLMLLAGRRGQIFFFNNFKTASHLNGNFNMVVVGASGRGKSVWLQEYSVSLLKNGGTVVIIDDGRSFKNTCELLDGDFVDFGGGGFCLNPFSLYAGAEEQKGGEALQEYKENFEEPFIDLVVSILCIITNVDKNNDFDPKIGLYRSIFTSSVTAVMEKYGNKGGFSDVRYELLNNPEIYREATRSLIDEIIVILDNYCGHGRYAKYFNGKATLDIKNNFTVFELSDLEKQTVLQSSALLTVTFLVYAKIRERKTQTALIIDEFWRMGKHPILRDPIGGFSRRGRKYNLSLIVASQCMSDFDVKTSEAGAIALSQADWRIILSVDGKDEKILVDVLEMEPGEIEVARNLRGVKGAYSEFMIRHSNSSWTIGRLLLDPFSSQLYSTKAEDVAAIKEMRKSGISVEDAIENLIRERS